MKARTFTLTGLLVVVGVVAVVAALVMPSISRAANLSAQKASLQAMSALVQAERDLYANDLDGNGKSDYWMKDVRGLTKFRRRGGSVGLIDEALAKADAAYPDARPIHRHYFLMVERDGMGRPLADATGFGQRLIYCVYPANYPQIRKTSVHDYDEAWWTTDNGGKPVRQWLHVHPGAEGWAKTD